eukprot:CAMPEP_0195603668 /NCGR_PEP_ID=MMETSP0815-20121206/6245_1 /TAXON_ID=97485 /ORGANISM="Prymnesium parvum, Strain Texoma1" /LENGTH=66 /DNA_ID=CAMNT_0040743299 /DNA_START=350 /DNA_END=547 /DNA_ORIENTATION=-
MISTSGELLPDGGTSVASSMKAGLYSESSSLRSMTSAECGIPVRGSRLRARIESMDRTAAACSRSA